MFLVTVHDPICNNHINLTNALEGSFLPVPSNDLFPLEPAAAYERRNAPGALILKKDMITINPGRERVRLRVTNDGDRPIQIGSHYHFIETNPALTFDRGLAYGKRLDIPAGTAVRFEPGDSKTVTLVAISGSQIIAGGNALASGAYDLSKLEGILGELEKKKYGHISQSTEEAFERPEEKKITRESYASMFGPTTGDRVRLGDTSLWVEVERDEVSFIL